MQNFLMYAELNTNNRTLLTVAHSYFHSVLLELLITLPRMLCNAQHLSVCLSVCQRLYVKITEQIFLKTDVPVGKEELIKLWKSSASGSGNF